MRVYASAEMTLTDTNDGISVTGIDRYYMASSSSSGITVGSQGWLPDPQETNPVSRYHWSYEVVKYSDGAAIPSKPAVIGVYGKEGKEGIDAVTVSLSSEAHTFAGTESKAIASSITIDVSAFKGNQRIPTSIGTVTGGITGQLTHSELGRGTTSNKLVINVTSSLAKGNGTLSIPIVADGRTFNKVFSWSVAFKGIDGTTTYTWIKYADTPTSGMDDSALGKKYIGLAFNQATQNESNDYSDYQWSLMPQNIDIGGRNLAINSTNDGKGWSSTDYNIIPRVELSEDWVVGETYTVSIKGTISEPSKFGVWRDTVTVKLGDVMNYNPLTGVHTQTFSNIKETTRAEKNVISVYNVPFTSTTNSSIEWIKVEKGDTSTDWSPAPEDLYKYSDDVAQAKANAERIKAESYADGKVTAEEKARIAQAEQVLKDAKAHALQSIQDIEIGGRNILSDTEGTFKVTKTNNSSFQDVIVRDTIGIPDGKEYILSFKAKASAPMVLRSHFYKPNTTTRAESSTGYIGSSVDGTVDTNITTEWNSYWIKWNQSETTAPKSVIVARIRDTFDNVALEMKEIKLEKGNTVTDWSPAPEDVEDAYTAVAQAKAEAERVKAEAYADDKVTAEEQLRIDDVNAKLAAAKKHAEDQINISEGKATSWKKTYYVNQSSPLKLTKLNGDALSPLNSYEVSAKVLNTGTITSGTSLFKAKESGGQTSNGWELVTIYTMGTISNHPEFFIDSDGDPAIRLYGHNSKYTVEVTHTEYTGSQTSYTLSEDVARAEAELARITAEAYADGKVTAEETARIADADAKLAEAKQYAIDQILADKTIKDTRNDNQTPAWYYTNHRQQTIKEFKFTSTIGVVSSEGTYGILETEIPWTDASGGPVKQTFRVNNKTFKRSGTTTSWSSWVSYDDMAEAAKSDAATAKGIADGAASSASTANNLLADIASDSKLTATEKKAAKKEWDIIVGEKPKIDSSADTYGIITQKTAYNTAYNTLNNYLSGLLANLNTTSNIVGTNFRANFKAYYNARQDLLNAIADGAKSLVDEIEIGGRNYLKRSDLGSDAKILADGGVYDFSKNSNSTTPLFANLKLEKGKYIYHIMMKKPAGDAVASIRFHKNNSTISYYGRYPEVDGGWNRIEIPFEVTDESDIYGSQIYNHNFGDSFAATVEVMYAKIEKGNKVTDWTPAPEDIEQELANHQDQLDKTIDTEQLNTVVADINADKLSVESYEEFLSSYEGTLDEVNRSIGDVATDIGKALSRTNIIETTLGEGAQDWLFTNTKIRMSDEGITLGDASSGTYLQISSERISFFAGATDEVAYVSGGMLYINKAIFVQSIQVAEYLISKELDGHLTYRFVGMV